MSGTSLSNSLLLPHEALDLMEQTYSSSFFETEPHFQLDDLCSNSSLELSRQGIPIDRPTIQEPQSVSGDRWNSNLECEQHKPKHLQRDKNIPASSSMPSRKNSIKVKYLTTVLSQSRLWHNLPMVRESGIVGE